MSTKKRIGLLTLPLKSNYGGIIQICALSNYLTGQGYETVLIDKIYSKSPLKAFAAYVFEHNPFYFLYDRKNATKKRLALKKISDTIYRLLPNRTQKYYSFKQLEEDIQYYDLQYVIVGSDQVWRMSFIQDNFKDYFLGFIDSKKTAKISYAASFGVDEWNDERNKQAVIDLLKDFKGISVRENTGVDICKNVLELDDVSHVLDPTLLVDIDFYDSIIKKEIISQKEIGLFNYVLDESQNNRNLIDIISTAKGLNVSRIELSDDAKSFSKGISLKPGLGDWLYHFKESEFVVTDSFHGTVFSIIYHKQFVCIGNVKRGLTRFTSLLALLGLEDRLVTEETSKERLEEILAVKIDFAEVDRKLNVLRLKSEDFLRTSLQ